MTIIAVRSAAKQCIGSIRYTEVDLGYEVKVVAN